MADDKNSTELAQDRTDWAEDRTMLANERTYAAWMRTGMASLGIGLALNALFARLEPVWIPKAVSTFFAMIGILIFVLAVRKAETVSRRLNAHDVEQIGYWPIRLIGGALSVGGLCFVASGLGFRLAGLNSGNPTSELHRGHIGQASGDHRRKETPRFLLICSTLAPSLASTMASHPNQRIFPLIAQQTSSRSNIARTTVARTFVAAGIAAMLAASVPASAAERDGDRHERRGPPPEAFAACASQQQGDQCEVQTPRGDTLSGQCVVPRGRPARGGNDDQTANIETSADTLVCKPDNRPSERQSQLR